MEGAMIWLATVLLNSLRLLFGYLNSNTFPQPLSEEEEARYLGLHEQGDPKAKNVLVERNLRLVAHVVKKFGNIPDSEDLISIGTVGLIKAIDTFDRKKGTKLATYAARCIENEILMFLRASKKTRAEVSIYDPIGVDKEGNEIALIDVLGSDQDQVAEEVGARLEQGIVRGLLERLEAKERLIVELRYGLTTGHRHTQREIARHLGISRSYVSRIEKRALAKLARELFGPR